LFGHEEGAFTGSRKGGKMGLFEQAHGGTIFLDEILEMDLAGQVNLLRALQERQIRRVGGSGVIPVDVRVIAACNANLNEMVREGRFRRDLYYRLSVLVLKIPPLRQRPTDVAQLASHFIEQYNRRFDRNVGLSAAAVRELESFGWDGNVRQLRNFCERLTAVADEPVINAAFVQKNLADSFWDDDLEPTVAASRVAPPAGSMEKGDSIMIKGVFYSKPDMMNLLARHRGNREAVARHLGVSRTTLWKYLRQFHVQKEG
jgi:transcriptional regulator with PAS, ATPase and Fis domain